LVQFPLEEGGTILVEVDEPELARNTIRGLAPNESLSMAEHTFEAAMESIKPAAAAIIAKLRELNQPPEIIGVEFGIKLSGGPALFWPRPAPKPILK
jgi:hypothetical protein